jgi:hypothetical protein
MKSFKTHFNEAKDTHCSDECCGADVKASDCDCPADCPHCNCNAVSEAFDPKHPKVMAAVKAVKNGTYNGNVDRNGNAIVHINGKPHTVTKGDPAAKHEDVNELTVDFINEHNITLEQLENMTEEELNELLGKAIGGAVKLAAKGVIGTGRLAKKAVVNKQGNIRGTQAAKNDRLVKQRDKLRQKRTNVVRKKLQVRNTNRLKNSIQTAKDKLARTKKLT